MSTAKSMANSYLSAKRIQSSQVAQARTLASQRFKSSTSNLTSANRLQVTSNYPSSSNTRLKSTSMTNLMTPDQQQQQQQRNQSSISSASKIQRPASRNALDSIHNGMNAKYAQVQSKVYLQNIRPPTGSNSISSSSKIPASQKSATLDKRTSGRTTPGAGGSQLKVPNDRSALMIKVKALEEEIERCEQECGNLKAELDREKGDKFEQISQLKQELQEKLAEHDKQNEEYHQKLLEAYELADQNRRAADSVLSESRQRDEDSRKKIEELEAQLNELKEFVTMKEEMTGKMYELREQIREERQRYEDQLKSLHQVFENEKIR